MSDRNSFWKSGEVTVRMVMAEVYFRAGRRDREAGKPNPASANPYYRTGWYASVNYPNARTLSLPETVSDWLMWRYEQSLFPIEIRPKSYLPFPHAMRVWDVFAECATEICQLLEKQPHLLGPGYRLTLDARLSVFTRRVIRAVGQARRIIREDYIAALETKSEAMVKRAKKRYDEVAQKEHDEEVARAQAERKKRQQAAKRKKAARARKRKALLKRHAERRRKERAEAKKKAKEEARRREVDCDERRVKLWRLFDEVGYKHRQAYPRLVGCPYVRIAWCAPGIGQGLWCYGDARKPNDWTGGLASAEELKADLEKHLGPYTTVVVMPFRLRGPASIIPGQQIKEPPQVTGVWRQDRRYRRQREPAHIRYKEDDDWKQPWFDYMRWRNSCAQDWPASLHFTGRGRRSLARQGHDQQFNTQQVIDKTFVGFGLSLSMWPHDHSSHHTRAEKKLTVGRRQHTLSHGPLTRMDSGRLRP